MAEVSLIKSAVISTGCLFILAACGSIFEMYPTADPGKIGRRVDQLHKEAMSSLPVKPTEPAKMSIEQCGEDWQDKETVSQQPNDPWEVQYNLYAFRETSIVSIDHTSSLSSFYRSILKNLQQIDGWNVSEVYSTSGLLSSIDGEKEGIDIYVSHSPDPDDDSMRNISISLHTKCFRHPNA